MDGTMGKDHAALGSIEDTGDEQGLDIAMDGFRAPAAATGNFAFEPKRASDGRIRP